MTNLLGNHVTCVDHNVTAFPYSEAIFVHRQVRQQLFAELDLNRPDNFVRSSTFSLIMYGHWPGRGEPRKV